MLYLGVTKVGIIVLYTSVFAIPLFIMLCSLRAVGALGWQLVRGPDRAGVLPKAKMGLVGASLAAGLAVGTTTLAGAEAWVAIDDWFYVMVIPGLIGFGIAAPSPRHPSIVFAATAAMLAICIGVTAIPVPAERHEVRCNLLADGGEHEVFYRAKEPRRWKNPKDRWEWLFAPMIFAELAFWHVVDPVTEADCPAP